MTLLLGLCIADPLSNAWLPQLGATLNQTAKFTGLQQNIFCGKYKYKIWSPVFYYVASSLHEPALSI